MFCKLPDSLHKQKAPSNWTGLSACAGNRAVYRTFKILPKTVQHSSPKGWYPINAVREYQPPLLQTAGADKQFHGRFRVLDIEQVSFIFSLSFFHGMGRTADRRSSPFHSYQKKVKKILTKRDVWSIINYAVRTISSAGRASA